MDPVATRASFRDPAGRLFRIDGRILRLVQPDARADLEAFLASAVARRLAGEGRLVHTEVVDRNAALALLNRDSDAAALLAAHPDALVVEHEAIEFPSYPYEWPPEMLHEAGRLTLDLAQALLADGLGLKDGTPFNVLFRGLGPVFVDVLSVERREPGDPTWLPYAQFARTFLLPLLANTRFGLALDEVFLGRRDGLEPEEVYRLCGPLARLLPPVFGLVTAPVWLGARARADDTALYQKKLLPDAERAAYILRATLARLRRSLDRLAPRPGRKSMWSDYLATATHYSREQFAAKEAFVASALSELKPRRVLDVGANTGYFTRIAARAGAGVVAIDYDAVAVGEIWRGARAEQLDVLPLVVNLARPTPATGWRNRECPAFLERAQGAFDLVMMLAVVHHMLVTERVPLAEIVDLIAALTCDAVVVEYVSTDDPMFRRIVRGREALHRDLTPESFESAWRQRFEIVRSLRPEGATRALYLLRRRDGAR
ncbi:MAG TPA: methyltransferase domain-containing protein [Terriglobales bacterium]|nr:methyltransferase domain-containing protein [Terriglobales bacterium]